MANTASAPLAASSSNTLKIPSWGEQTVSGVADGERKTVTALFADIKGSTQLMQGLDPEEARAIIDPALKIMAEAVSRYDGYVVQSTGDGIFALFGAPAAYEDHPQRALYAALQIQRQLREYGKGRNAESGSALEVRIGADTGEVVVRTLEIGGKVEYTPIGHTANVASRLQTVAPAGSVVVSEKTRKLVEGYFELRALGPTEIKGLREPIKVYEVSGLGPLRTHFQASARRGLTEFVGREHEIAQLHHALELACGGHGQVVAVVAEAGTGKSRLLYEFKRLIPNEFMVLEAYSISHGKASPYQPVVELLYDYFGIGSVEDKAARRAKIENRVEALDSGLRDICVLLFALLGIQDTPDPLAQMDLQIRRQRTLEALKRMALRESLNHPLVMIFEDLHWIDSQTQGFLDLLADGIANARILLLVNYRPEYRHQWSNKSYYTQLRLDQLGAENAAAMLEALLGKATELEPFKRLITEKTGGNPFFIEEMVQALFDEGVIVRNGAAKMVRPLSQLQLPPTVQGILASRIDRLPSPQKDLLQTLAVIGRESPLQLIRKIVARPDNELVQMLAALQVGEFIYEQPVASGTDYTFKHALTQEVAYNSLLIERRKLLHERAGHAIESLFAERLDDYLEALARHYSRSGNVHKAIEYLAQAGQQAVQRSSYGDGIGNLTAGLDLLTKLPESPERIQKELLLQLTLGSALIPVKGWAALEVPRAFLRVRELAEQLGNPVLIFRALIGLWSVHVIRAEMRTAHALAEQALRIAQSTQDSTQLLLAHVAMGGALFGKGEFLLSRDHLEAAISLYQPEYHGPSVLRASVDTKVSCLANLGVLLWALGYPDRGLKRAHEAVEFARSLSHPHSLANAEQFLGVLYQGRREAVATQQTAEILSEACAKHGFTMLSALAIGLRGWAMAERGQTEEGIRRIKEGIAAYRATGAEFGVANNFNQLARICTEAARFDDASMILTEALTLENAGQGYFADQAETFRLKGELLLRQGRSNLAEAQNYFERAIQTARNQGAKSFELRAVTSLARLLAMQGRRDEAYSMLAELYGWFTEGLDTADVRDANALLQQLKA